MANDEVARLREAKQKIAETRNGLAAVRGFAALKADVDNLIGGTVDKNTYTALISAINTVVAAHSAIINSLADCDREAAKAIELAIEDERRREQQERNRRR